MLPEEHTAFHGSIVGLGTDPSDQKVETIASSLLLNCWSNMELWGRRYEPLVAEIAVVLHLLVGSIV